MAMSDHHHPSRWASAQARGAGTVVGLALGALLLMVGLSGELKAQVIRDTMPPDTTVVPVITLPDSAPLLRRRIAVITPPLSPRRAFLMSFAVPGWAQAKLDRTTSGALFAAVEMGSIAMLRRSVSDVREVLRQGRDTIPGNFTVNPATGALTPGAPVDPRFDLELERTRRLHVEDWIAAIAFNHLISASDAFVSALLWDVPTRVTLTPTADGRFMLAATIRW